MSPDEPTEEENQSGATPDNQEPFTTAPSPDNPAGDPGEAHPPTDTEPGETPPAF